VRLMRQEWIGSRRRLLQPSSASKSLGAINSPLKSPSVSVGLVAGLPIPAGVTVGVAWVAFIGSVIAAGIVWARAPHPELESEFDPGPGDDVEFMRGDQVKHSSGRRGRVMGPGDPGKSLVKWLDTWDVSQANNRHLELDDDH
jgi:hypothetical protein